MRYQGIIFDLDGVLCHTDKYHFQAWGEIARILHIPFDETVNNRLRGVSREESLEILLEQGQTELTREEKERYMREKNERYRGLLAKMKPNDLEPEVRRALLTLREGGVKLAVGSSSKNAPYILERLGLTGFFDAVADGTQITRTKPDPQVFQLAGERLGLPPEALLVVEDAAVGVSAAHAAGMDCAAVGDAARQGAAEYALNSLGELPGICFAGAREEENA